MPDLATIRFDVKVAFSVTATFSLYSRLNTERINRGNNRCYGRTGFSQRARRLSHDGSGK
jgi:hypothetical protein